MKHLKRFAKYLLLLLSPILVYGLSALTLAYIPVNSWNTVSHNTGETIEIFILSNGIHSDFVVPIQNTTKNWHTLYSSNDFPKVDSSRVRYLSFGWGDRGFYLDTPTWEELTITTAIHAVFLPSPTVIHLDTWYLAPEVGENCKPVSLQSSQYHALVNYIESSFLKDENGYLQLIPNQGYTQYDNFYQAKGSYHLFNTCNNWTNRGLKQIGVKTALWSPFVDGVMRHL